jgi:alpha-1,2-mannosyltransferase
MDGSGRRGSTMSRRVLVTGAVLFLVSVAAVIVADSTVRGGQSAMLDLQVYDWGGHIARHSGDLYGASYGHGRLRFTYPPMAAAVFAVLSYTPLPVLKWVVGAGSIAALTAVTWLTWGALGYPRSRERLGGTLAVASIGIWTEPAQQTLSFGQVNILLMLIIVADLCLPDRVRHKGAGVGFAAGFKLTPLIFIPYLLLTGRVRAAGVALAAFAATVTAGAILLPSQSGRYWAGRLFLDPRRLGNVGYVGNQSLYGMLLRLTASPGAAHVAWLVAAVSVGAGGLLLAAAAERKQEVGGVVVCGLTGLLISPVSWTHHWVWTVPALVLAVHGAVRMSAAAPSRWRRWAAWRGPLALIVVFCSRLVWTVPASTVQGRGMRGAWLIVGNLYVVAGLAALGAAALVLARPPLSGIRRGPPLLPGRGRLRPPTSAPGL